MSSDRDETLAAWLDGAMTADEARSFEAELAADPELAERALRWKANDTRIAAAFAPLSEQPVDAALLERMGLGGPSLPKAANDNPPWWRRHALPLGGAIAASLLIIALVTQRAPASRDTFQIALETTPSLGQARLADGRMLQPTLTVRAADGRFCREYRIAESVGLACRAGGTWNVEAQGKGSGPSGTGEIGVAGGGDTAVLDPAYKRIGASDPLDAKAEAALIAKGW